MDRTELQKVLEAAAKERGCSVACLDFDEDDNVIDVTLVKEIAAACREQASGGAQINTAVQRFNVSTQQFASISEEMASNSDNLKLESEKLMMALGYFKHS